MVEITKVLLLYKVDDKVSCVSSLMLNSFCLRRPQDKWETMIGWNAPEDYDETGIDAWVRRKSSKVKATGKKAALRQEWDEYACTLGTHCSAIPEVEVFLAESLRESLKPQPKKEFLVAKPTREAKEKQDTVAGGKNYNKSVENSETNTLLRAKRLLGLSQTQKKTVKENGNKIQDEEEGESETWNTKDNSVSAISPKPSSKGRDVPVIRRNELDIGVNHLITERQGTQDLLPKFAPRDIILRQLSKSQNTSGSDVHSILSSRQTERQEVLPASEPVKLCYTQSNISLMLEKPVEKLVKTHSREYLSEDSDTKGEEEEEVSSLTPHLDDLVSDAGSWEMDSDLEDYPRELLSKPSSTYTPVWGEPTGVVDYSNNLGKYNPMSRFSIASHNRADQIIRARLENGGPAVSRGLADIIPVSSPISEIKKSPPISLVLKTVVLDNVRNGESAVCQSVQDHVDTRNKKSKKSAKSRTHSARTHQSPRNSPALVRTGQSLNYDTDLPLLPHTKTFTLNLESYTNSYKERLSSRVMPIGDLLPAVDTSLKSVLTGRKPMQSSLDETRFHLPPPGNTNGELSISRRDRILRSEENVILSSEGAEMLKFKDTPTLVGPPAFRSYANRTPLHRAQENTHKRLYGQLGSTNGTGLPSAEEVLVRIQQAQAGRWQSSNGSLYSAPPRLGYVPGTNKEGEVKGSQGEPTKSPPTSHSTSSSTLNSLYKRITLRIRITKTDCPDAAGLKKDRWKPLGVDPRRN